MIFDASLKTPAGERLLIGPTQAAGLAGGYDFCAKRKIYFGIIQGIEGIDSVLPSSLRASAVAGNHLNHRWVIQLPFYSFFLNRI